MFMKQIFTTTFLFFAVFTIANAQTPIEVFYQEAGTTKFSSNQDRQWVQMGISGEIDNFTSFKFSSGGDFGGACDYNNLEVFENGISIYNQTLTLNIAGAPFDSNQATWANVDIDTPFPLVNGKSYGLRLTITNTGNCYSPYRTSAGSGTDLTTDFGLLGDAVIVAFGYDDVPPTPGFVPIYTTEFVDSVVCSTVGTTTTCDYNYSTTTDELTKFEDFILFIGWMLLAMGWFMGILFVGFRFIGIK
jgi:hypothetical protein